MLDMSDYKVIEGCIFAQKSLKNETGQMFISMLMQFYENGTGLGLYDIYVMIASMPGGGCGSGGNAFIYENFSLGGCQLLRKYGGTFEGSGGGRTGKDGGGNGLMVLTDEEKNQIKEHIQVSVDPGVANPQEVIDNFWTAFF